MSKSNAKEDIEDVGNQVEKNSNLDQILQSYTSYKASHFMLYE